MTYKEPFWIGLVGQFLISLTLSIVCGMIFDWVGTNHIVFITSATCMIYYFKYSWSKERNT